PLITVLTVDDRDRVCLSGATTVQIYENGECIFMCELDTITWGKTVSSLTVRDSSIWFGISYSVNDLKGFPFLYHIDADTITPVMVDSTFGVYDIGFLGDATVLATPTGIQWMTAADTVIVRLPDRLIHPSIPDLIANDSLLFIAQAGPLYQINSYNRGISIYNHSTDRWSVTRDSYGIFRLAVLGQYTAALNQDSKIYLYQNDRLLYRIPLDYYSCNDIAFDPDTNLWVLSTEGILFKGREELNFSIHPYTRHLLGSVGDRYDLYTLSPVSSREVYVSTPNGLYEFHPDSVKIYDPSNSPLNDPFVTAFGLTSDRTLYIGTHSGGLYRKRESLIEPVNLDSPNNDFGMISHINQDPEGIIWVSTMGKGIYYSHDNQWTHLGMENRGLPVNRVTATARIGRDLYLGTMSDGLWILDLTTLPVGETLSDHHESSVPLTVKAYPNPFTSVIHLEIPRQTGSPSGAPDAPVCLQIRNLMGQMVLSKIIDRSHSSVIRFVWNGRNQRGESLPSGIYLYQIKAGEWITSGHLTHLK
ncbi:MAG: T9SS type A sorting domain-containing protein, partial [Candidatus Delongbacteria bacterium]|nr:T9SS type A sorting domain-containing protein [Candidatus Delongbacteria bacterium]